MAAEPSEPAAVALVSGAPRIKTLTIRLDDGTVIRRDGSSSMPQVLKPAEAWQAGMLTEDHLLRMQALLCEVHAKLPEEGPLKSVTLGSKRSLDSVLEVGARAIAMVPCFPCPAPQISPKMHIYLYSSVA